MDVKITILQVEVANLRPNPWNTNSVGAQNFEKLKGSIEKLGFFKPILARELDGGVFEILGGEHRWRAAMEQGISTVPVISVGKINDLVAKQMSLVDNERYGEDDQVALQRLIEEIQSEIDYRLSDIAPYDDEMAATLAKASVIDLEALEALSRGDDESVDEDKREKTERVGAEHQTMRFKPGSVLPMLLSVSLGRKKMRSVSWRPATRKPWIKPISLWGRWVKAQKRPCRLISLSAIPPNR